MLRHLILCPEDTTWTMSPESFRTKLKDRWPEAEFRSVKTSGIAFGWSIPIEDVHLLGTFHRDGLTVGLEGPFEGYAIFACWYRSMVPFEVPLILMDQDYNEVYPLTSETTPDDILSDRIVLRPPPEPHVLFTRTRKPHD